MQYKSYKVKNGKEYIVEDEEGNKYCGDYVEKLLEDDESISVGLYDDPIRGEDEVATLNNKSLKEGVCVAGDTGVGRSNLLNIIESQVSDEEAVIRFDYKTNEREEQYDIVVDDINPSFIFNYDENDEDQVSSTFKQIFTTIYESNNITGESFSQSVSRLEEEIGAGNVSDIEDVQELFYEMKEEDDHYRPTYKRVVNSTDLFDGDEIDFEEVLEEGKRVLIKLDERDFRGLKTKLVLQELFKYDAPSNVILDDAEKAVEKELDDQSGYFVNWGDLFATHRPQSVGLVLSFSSLGSFKEDLAHSISGNIDHWILFNKRNQSEAQKLAQNLMMSGHDLRELELYEAYMKPVTPDGNKSDINVRVRIFPPLKP